MLRAANEIVLDVLRRILDNLGCSELMLYRILARLLFFLPRLSKLKCRSSACKSIPIVRKGACERLDNRGEEDD